ncbi:CMP-N-acetylneuraminate-beta-galactosamide-alpha-2,3-sialyltransferase 2 [Pundamilia nyererei]|uniref:CMP-N-acetylneuraminate-beta-galactosamide-alpha-2,3-sialyltransferase 2 n=4 Tax=Pseudocrenilabrinae TaxID=318546 RepID=A0A9Y6M703_9CICH|nr:PREDICTED: CMP-N-acetylneuraminate-beta-galactosamide-alpha-2,3-sialyltransferase 2 [Pundamilia nyererei]
MAVEQLERESSGRHRESVGAPTDKGSDCVVHTGSQWLVPVTVTRPWWLLSGGTGGRGGGSCGLGTVAGPGVGTWPWGGRIPSSTLHRDRRWGWGSWSGGASRGAPRISELRPWLSGGMVTGGGSTGVGGGAEKGGRVRCSRRIWVLLGSLVLIFLTSLFLSVSLRGGVGFNYLEPPGWEESRRVKLVPSYMGAHRLSSPDAPQQKTCACPRCVGDPGVSDWFDENYDPDISPVWTRDNMQLPSDVYYWWVMLQPQFKPHSIQQVLLRLFQVIPGRSPYGSWDPGRCLRCAVVGNSGNLRGARYGATIDDHNYIMRINLAPTVGYEEDAGSHTTHHFMYPESAKNLAANVSFVLVPFKTLDLVWITSALSTGQIRFTYAPVKQFLRVDKDKVQIFNPAFFKYIHDRWTRHHGRYPSTGMLVLFFALHVCDEVNVFGFGADSRGNWHHYWEQNRYSGEFRKTGVHDADYEAQIIERLAKAGKITVFPGK